MQRHNVAIGDNSANPIYFLVVDFTNEAEMDFLCSKCSYIYETMHPFIGSYCDPVLKREEELEYKKEYSAWIIAKNLAFERLEKTVKYQNKWKAATKMHKKRFYLRQKWNARGKPFLEKKKKQKKSSIENSTSSIDSQNDDIQLSESSISLDSSESLTEHNDSELNNTRSKSSNKRKNSTEETSKSKKSKK
jgi:hypothetical protein